MAPTPRLLRLLSLLQARPIWPAGELAERLEVDRHTVRRDMARLRGLGYPVKTSPGRSGYQLGAGGRLPPLLLDDEEAVAMAVGRYVASRPWSSEVISPDELRVQNRRLGRRLVRTHPVGGDR